MANKDPDRKRLLHALKARERAAAEAAFPVRRAELERLFAALAEQLATLPCDHSLRLTVAWAEKAGVNTDLLVRWARENGGFCDCEVLANVPDTNAALRT